MFKCDKDKHVKTDTNNTYQEDEDIIMYVSIIIILCCSVSDKY